MKRVAILGLGLMGGSLGLALKSRRAGVEVVGYARRLATRREALRRGAVDRVCARPEDAVRGADVVVICVPVLTIPRLAAACAPALAPGCVVTDVGSTKEALVRVARRRLRARGVEFVGSHPIAGSAATGIGAARADLYAGATVVLTPTPAQARGAAGRRAVAVLRALWRRVGGRVLAMAPAAHDAVLARTSHLPHLVAAALVQAVCRGRDVRRFCGAGFRDTTRIAAGSDEMWHDILQTNRRAILRELKRFEAAVATLRKSLAAGRFAAARRFLQTSRALRRDFDA